MSVPAPDTQPAEQQIPNKEKQWKVGTLTYSFSALVTLFFVLLIGDFAWSLRDRAVGPVAQLMLKRFEASDLVVGLLMGSLPTALGLIIGPIIGIKSDRYRSKWGRRIPFMLIPVPFATLSMLGLAFCPWLGRYCDTLLGVHSPGALTLGLVWFVVFWTMFDIASIVANSVFGGLINDVVPQVLLGRFFGMFRIVSLLVGIFFNFYGMGHADEHYGIIFIGTGLVYGVGVSWMCCKVKEGEYPPPEQLTSGKGHTWKNVKIFFMECFHNPYYLWMFTALTFAGICTGPFNSFSVFYAKSIGMSMDSYGKYLALTYIISLTISYPLGAIVDRVHPLRACIPVLAVYAVCMLWGGVVATTPGTFAVAFVLHGVLSGTYFTVASSLAQRLFPKDKFAQFGSGCGLFGSVINMSIAPLVGALLDYTHHEYRYTFTISGVLTIIAVGALIVVHQKFMKYGGPKNYVAPE